VLVGLDVPAYVLAMDMSDGSTRYRIYAGAYANEQEATYLRGHLEAQGLNDPTLSTRVGRIP
jgi:cell division protein FtsN